MVERMETESDAETGPGQDFNITFIFHWKRMLPINRTIENEKSS